MSGPSSSHPPAPGFDRGRHAWLAALGLVPLRRRAAFLPEVAAENAAIETAAAQALPSAAAQPESARVPKLRLFVEGAADPFAGADAKLLHAILAALGLSAADVTGEADAALPLLAFGRSPEPAGFRVPALASLRDPIGKRVAWKELRRLKRALAGTVR